MAGQGYTPQRRLVADHPNNAVLANDLGGYGAAPQSGPATGQSGRGAYVTNDPLDADIGRSCSVPARRARRDDSFVAAPMPQAAAQAAGVPHMNADATRSANRFEPNGFHRKVLPAGMSQLAKENKNLNGGDGLDGRGGGNLIGTDMRGNVRVVGPRSKPLPQAQAEFEAAVEARARELLAREQQDQQR